MSELTLDRDKCAQRRRIAARRDGVNSAPMRFLRAKPEADKATLEVLGWLPETEKEAIERINTLRPNQEGDPLKAKDVYIHYIEAANGSFIADRYAFMSERTLKNIATNAAAGFSFMNSHRTGGLSSGPAELPYGRTFAGRYERTADGDMRAFVGFYMLRGEQPNGPMGPSTDAIHAAIEGGTIFDVSVGLWGGDHVCDVCGKDIYERGEHGEYACPHVPGTQRGMKTEEITAQKGRGVKEGRASYTIDDARCGEVSAVYDGAVDGAGFNKAMAFRSRLTEQDRSHARDAFASLLSGSDFESKPGDPATDDSIASLVNTFESLISELGRPRVAAVPINNKPKGERAMSDTKTAEDQEKTTEAEIKKLAAANEEQRVAMQAQIDELTKLAKASEDRAKEAELQKLTTEANAKVDGWEREGKFSGNGTAKVRAVYVAIATKQAVSSAMIEEMVAALPKFDTTRIAEKVTDTTTTDAKPTREEWLASEKGDRPAKAKIDAFVKSRVASNKAKSYTQHLTEARMEAFAN